MKALFISENEDDCSLLNRLFATHFSQINLITCTNEEESMDLVAYDGPFAVIIIDAEIRDFDPTKMGIKILDFCGERPIIYFGTPAMIRDRVKQEAFDEGELSAILHRPVDIEEFKVKMNDVLNWANDKDFEESILEVDKSDYLNLHIRNFFLFENVPYDVYLEVTETKFLKVISCYKRYYHSQLIRYIQQGVKKLYLLKEDQIKFLDFTIDHIMKLFKKNTYSPLGAIKLQIKSASVLQEFIRDVGVNKKVSMLALEIIKSVHNNFQEIKTLKELFKIFTIEQKDLAERSILIFYICEFILITKDFESFIPRKILGLSALIHDIALPLQTNPGILSLNDPILNRLTKKDYDDFLNHSILASQISEQFYGFSEVSYVIAQHHELPDGNGFPGSIRSYKLPSMSCIFIVVFQFVTRLLQDENQDKNNIIKKLSRTFKSGKTAEMLKVIKNNLDEN